MPAASPEELVAAILEAIQASGGTATLVSPARANPRKFIVAHDGATYPLWIFVWTLTPGGRPQLAAEYRIQMTSVSSPLEANPDGPTLLLGYEPDRGLFAGFDFALHRTFTEGSPSVQIAIDAVERSTDAGLNLFRKSNDEIAVGIRPDHFLAYTATARVLHGEASRLDIQPIVVKALAAGELSSDELSQVPVERRRTVQSINRLARDARFRVRVISAYGGRCAVTGVGLGLIEAAHILPVWAPGSTDETANGIALTPTLHRAFDDGLIYIDRDFGMSLNPDRVAELRHAGNDAGLAQLEGMLGRIRLPDDPTARPHPALIAAANRLRKIPGW